MKHYIFLSTILLSLAVLTSCTDDFAIVSTNIEYRGEPVDAYLNITVGELAVSMDTRADVYDPYEDTEAERWVNDLWIFQYDALTKGLIDKAQYLTIESQELLEELPVILSDNNGDPSLIYVVTNTGDASWGSDETAFATVDDLLADVLPSHEPIFVTSETKPGDLSIPMEGNSGSVRVVANSVIIVPVERMYAKLMIAEPVAEIYVDADNGQGTVTRQKAETEVYSISIGNIPLYCRVGTLYTNDATGATYPDDVQWISRAFEASLDTINRPSIVQPDAGTEGNTYYPYVLYVPENLAGQAGIADTLKLHQQAMAPDHALQLNVVITVHNPTDDSETQYPYVFYPGADIYTDYNIKRNNVYRVKTEIDALSVARVPSANSFVGIEGHTISFFPYYRVETGGGYDFTDYLDPYGATDAQTTSRAKIDHVGIVWQTKDCIGDNSSGNLVYFTNQYGAKIDSSTAHNGYEQIHVKANKEGNALIAAYDTKDNILWSWHIWVRTEANGDPTHPANALIYYTYDWDNTGIYSYQREEMDDGAPHRRVAGYELMACNLGALQDEPNYANNTNFTKVTDPTKSGMSDSEDNQTFQSGDGIVRTYGMLYQWGRKDPFPPMIKTDGCLAYHGTGSDGKESDYCLPDNALNSGYYVHNYDDDHTEQLYGNDNTTEVHKTSYGDNSTTSGYFGSYTGQLFHSHIHNAATDGITGMRYAIAHPTVFLSGASTIAVCLEGSNSTTTTGINADYTSPLNQSSIASDGSIANYAFGGAWSDEDHDNKEWGGLEPDEGSMKYYHITYPDYTTTGTKKGQQMTDNASRSISLWDNYDNGTPEASKSIFDPCPYGWRVASGDIWIGFARNGISPYIDFDRKAYDTKTTEWFGDMSNINRDPERSCGLGMTMYLGQEWMTEPTTWFPTQGFILPDGSAYRVGGCGNYVNANTDVNDRVNVVHFHETLNSYRQFEVQTHYTAKSTGNPLRCVRDSK